MLNLELKIWNSFDGLAGVDFIMSFINHLRCFRLNPFSVEINQWLHLTKWTKIYPYTQRVDIKKLNAFKKQDFEKSKIVET